jgi:hypothetical protein
MYIAKAPHTGPRSKSVRSELAAPSICHQPNWSFNADANTGHAFGIFMASVGALRPYGLRRRLTWALGLV